MKFYHLLYRLDSGLSFWLSTLPISSNFQVPFYQIKMVSTIGRKFGALPLEWTVLNKLNSAALQLHHCRAVFLCRCGIIQIVFLHRRKYTQFTLIAPLIVIFYVAGYHIYQRLSARISVQIVSFSL